MNTLRCTHTHTLTKGSHRDITACQKAVQHTSISHIHKEPQHVFVNCIHSFFAESRHKRL